MRVSYGNFVLLVNEEPVNKTFDRIKVAVLLDDKRTQVEADIVGTVLFLASADSDFVTGQTISVDGGTHFL